MKRSSLVTVDVLGNDSDVNDGLDPGVGDSDRRPSNSSTSVNPDGGLDYANPDFFGTDSSPTRCPRPGRRACDTATATITVDQGEASGPRRWTTSTR